MTPSTTPLTTAVKNEDLAAVTHLLNQKANPNEPDARGKTPLQLAVKKGRLGMVEALLAAGANPDKKNIQGQSLMVWAANNGLIDIALTLLTDDKKERGGSTPLIYAIRLRFNAGAIKLLDQGADPNQTDQTGYTPLEWATLPPKMTETTLSPHCLIRALILIPNALGTTNHYYVQLEMEILRLLLPC
jgi:ankyrin repeat protein